MAGVTHGIKIYNIGVEFAVLALPLKFFIHHNFNALVYEQERIYKVGWACRRCSTE